MTLQSRSSRRGFVVRFIAGSTVFCLGGLEAGAASAGSRFLDHVRTVDIAKLGTFIAAERLGVSRVVGGRRVGALGFNFERHFAGLVEHDVAAASVAAWNLRYTVGDAALVEAPIACLAYVYAWRWAPQVPGTRTGAATLRTSARPSITGCGLCIGH